MKRLTGLLVIALVAAVAAATQGVDPVLAIPGETSKLAFDSSGFAVVSEEGRPDGSAKKVVYAHTDKRINLTIVMKPNDPAASPASNRDGRWQQLQSSPLVKEEHARLSEEADRAFMDYVNETGIPGVAHQRHIHTFLVQGRTKIEVHVSINQFTERDERWLEAFQRSIKIVG